MGNSLCRSDPYGFTYLGILKAQELLPFDWFPYAVTGKHLKLSIIRFMLVTYIEYPSAFLKFLFQQFLDVRNNISCARTTIKCVILF